MEFERKYLLDDPPADLRDAPSRRIEQVYVVVTEDEELRVRRKGSVFWLTLKKGSGKARQEVEIEISDEQYELFAEQRVGKIIYKTRFDYPLGKLTAEVDVYGGHLEGLATVEVEFPSEEEMESFTAPTWFGEEVSMSEEFKNKSLALSGFPTSLVEEWRSGTRPAWHYKQAGAVPYRRAGGRFEVLLVTSRRAGRWIVPKGIVEPDMSPAESAAKEVLEEAGVVGQVDDHMSETYLNRKWGGVCTVTLFPMFVTESHERWAEDSVRERMWVAREDIEDSVENTDMANAITKLLDELEQN